MFRRIGKFIEDISETVRRERGKLQILSEKIKFTFGIGELHERESNLRVKNVSSLNDEFCSKDLKTESEKITIKGEVDRTRTLRVFAEEIVFETIVNKLDKPRARELSVVDGLNVDWDVSLFDGYIEDFDIDTPINALSLHELEEIQIKENEKVEISGFVLKNKELNFDNGQIQDSTMAFHLIVSDLNTDFARFQAKSFHLENASVINALIQDYNLFFRATINETLSCVLRFPVRRTRVPKSGYSTEDLKNALSFIVQRYPNEGRLGIVGIYKNVPIESAERLTFSRNGQLSFYLKRADNKRPLLMDVLVVKTNKGKYHIGPIIRAT